MFWGNGDSSKLSPEERSVLDALKRLAETGHIVSLEPEQTKVALAAVKFYQNVTATTGVIAGARNTLIFIGSIFMMYWASQDVIAAILKKLITP